MIKSIKEKDFEGKTVLLRADLNSDTKNKKVILGERIKEASKTINYLKKQGAKVVVIAHQSRPGKKDFIGLRQHAKLLKKYVKIKFVKDILSKEAEKAIKGMNSGDAILLDNIRMEKDEFKPGKKTNKLKKLNKWCDVYVNDAFSVCHRKQFSIVGFPRLMESYAGLLLEREVEALKKINIGNCLCILGGAKPKDNIKLLGKKVLACGLFGQMCLIAKGKELGAQNNYLKNYLKDYDSVLNKLKGKLERVEMPEDFAVKKKGKRKELDLNEFPSEYEIFDIGKKTQKKFIKKIKKASAVYMKGPAGDAADKRFDKGTKKILKSITGSKGYSIIGGGHLSDAIDKFKINKNKFNHVSLSGGALLRYIAGEKLPGLQALKRR